MEEAEILLRPEWEQAMREEGNFACFSTKGRRKGKEELEERRLYIMKTGFAKKCVNPPYGAPITGYYSTRLTKGILDDLFVRAVAFD